MCVCVNICECGDYVPASTSPMMIYSTKSYDSRIKTQRNYFVMLHNMSGTHEPVSIFSVAIFPTRNGCIYCKTLDHNFGNDVCVRTMWIFNNKKLKLNGKERKRNFHLLDMTSNTLIGTFIFEPMIGHTTTRLLGHTPRIDTTPCIAHVQRFVILWHGQRCYAGRFRVILAIVSRVHCQLGTKHQLSMPLKSFEENEPN